MKKMVETSRRDVSTFIFTLLILTFAFFPLPSFSADWTIPLGSDSSLASGSYVFDTLTVNGTLLCKSNTVTNTGVIITCHNLSVGTYGRLMADSQGYPIGQGPGKPTAETFNYAGGGYGGYGEDGGGVGGGKAGRPYGSIKTPVDLGSGGGNGSYPAGGALAIYVSNELAVNGIISADGWPGNSGSSGGSIYIRTKILSGNGQINANGGTQLAGSYGNGGGGRIAVYYDDKSNFTGAIIARKGLGGNGGIIEASSGTVFLKSSSQTNGDLILDGGSYADGYHTLITGAYDSIQMKNYARCESDSRSLPVTASFVSDNVNNIILYSGGTIGASTLPSNDFSLISATLEVMSDSIIFNNLTIKQNGKLTHTANYDSQPRYKLNLTVNNNLTIEQGGYIDVSGRGYPAGIGPGIGSSTYYGGSYADRGGTSVSGTPGTPYGSETEPIDLGSGGNAGAGGGATLITVWGTMDVDGFILAEGGTTGHGNGSGGSILIRTPNFTGGPGGKLSVKGGGANSYYGSGSGGRIAVYYDIYDYLGYFDTTCGVSGYDQGGKGTKYLQQMTFYLVPRVASIDNPAYPEPITGTRPSFKWTAPTDQENDVLHFNIEVSQDSTFVSASAVLASSDISQTGFQYSADNGISWQGFSSAGISSNASPAIRVSYTVQTDLAIGSWYWRVRAKDRDGNGSWSATGSLPSIIKDVIARISSPEDSGTTYAESVTVKGIVKQAVSAFINVNGSTQTISVIETAFSVEAVLSLGRNTISVYAIGTLGNVVYDTVTVWRLKIPLSSADAVIGREGGTVRLDDWDGNPLNDARIEIEPDVLNNNTTVKIMKTETKSFPEYEITINNKPSYQFRKKVKLTLTYAGTTVTPENEEQLKIFYWDGLVWRVVGGNVDKTNRTVSCFTNHASRFAVMVIQETKDIAITVAPTVFTPNHDGINDVVTFNIVPKTSEGKAEIKIYETTGKTIRIITENDVGSGISISWDGFDENGKSVESGAYIYTVTVSGIMTTGTLVVAR